MTEFPSQPTLPQLQSYIARVCRERGWDRSNLLETYLLFSEEVGELAKAIRAHRSLYPEVKDPQADQTGADPGLEEEFADVLSYLLELANRLGVNLERAFRDKEAANEKRRWKN